MLYYFDYNFGQYLEDVMFNYFIPSTHSMHSSSIRDVYSYYIFRDQQTYNLNTWAFLKRSEIQMENTHVNTDDKKLVEINESVYLLKYEVKNAGHTLVNILYQINNYFLSNLKIKIMVPIELLKMSSFIESIIYLFFNKEDLIIINSQSLYKIKKMHHVLWVGYTYPNIDSGSCNLKIRDIQLEDNIYCINYVNEELLYNKEAIEQFLCNKIKLHIDEIRFVQPIKNKKICLIKNADDIINSNYHIDIDYSLKRAFNGSYVNFFKENEFDILNASNYTVLDLWYLLNNCELLVLSWGCIAYINKLIINNPNVKTLIISHLTYTHEFKFSDICHQSPSCKNVKLIYNLKSELDESSKLLIKSELDLLEKIVVD